MTAPRVLVVDDDPAIVQIYKEVLDRDGFETLVAGSCAQALTRLEEVRGDVRALVVDLGLPDGDGSDFARTVASRFGERPALYVSGWTDEFWQLEDLPGPWLIMRKPVPIAKLRAAVQWLAFGGEKPALDDDDPRS